jgi:BioD-like phosphotransacetylase family protein
LAALYITSPQAGAGKTLVCAGLGRHLKSQGKKVGFFKPLVAAIKSQEAADSDAAFIKRILSLKEPLEDLCPAIGGEGDIAKKVKQAYAKVAKGKDVVIIEGIWRRRPGAQPIESSYEIARALEAKVIVVEGYSPELLKTKFADKYRGFGQDLFGIVINKVPLARMEAVRGLGGVVGIIPEDRTLLSLSIAELAELTEGKIVNKAGKSSELVENYMLGALGVDSGLDYFGRKIDKAVVVKSERPDMQLAALQTPTKCLVISGDGEPIYEVLKSAEDKGIPIIVTGENTVSVIDSIEQALGMTKFNQSEKLPRLAEVVKQQFDFKALYQGLGLVG